MQAPSLTIYHPIPRLAILCLLGLTTGLLTEPWMGRFSRILPLLCLLLLVPSLLSIRARSPIGRYTRLCCTLALILFAVWRSVEPIQQHRDQEEWIERYLVPVDRPVTMSGIVRQKGQTRRGRDWMILEILVVSLEETSTHGKGRIRLYAHETDMSMEAYKIGDRVVSSVHQIRQSRIRAPHLFDPQAWRVREGFHAEATLLEIFSVEKPWPVEWTHRLSTTASRIRAQLSRIPIDEPMKSVLRALLTGDRSGLDPVTEAQLSRAGVSHLMAVSGLHVGLIVAPFWWLFVKFRWHWSGLLIWIGTGCVLLLYVEIAEQSPSVSRAALMSWLAGLLMIPMRRLPTTHLLLLAGMILLLWRPVWIQHPGFQLSMVAVWSIRILYAPVERKLRSFVSSTWFRKVLSMVLMTAILQVALAPFLVWWFGEISVVAPLANVLVVPLVPLVTLSGWGWVLLNALHLDGGVLVGMVEWVILWILYWTEHLSTLSWATRVPGWWVWIVLVPALVLSTKGYTWILDSQKRTWYGYMMLLLLVFESYSHIAQRHQLVVTVLDVGQGDAIHIQTPNGLHLLVDAGPKQAAEQVLIPYLNASGVERIDTLLLTHPHADHTGGVLSLSEEMAIGSIVRASRADSDASAESLDMLGVPIQVLDGGEIWEMDPALRLYVLDTRVVDATVNNRSLVIKLVYGETSFLLTGDAERRQESDLVRTYGTWLGVDVLKAGHHGSKTSSQRLFLRFVDPSWTIISAGWMNRYGHPHRETLERLHRQGSDVRMTAGSGAVRMVSDGSGIDLVRWK
ncbi:MAG: DNA internalization-related competence protein ComEC/Rec2 [Balneolaceae bacterium]